MKTHNFLFAMLAGLAIGVVLLPLLAFGQAPDVSDPGSIFSTIAAALAAKNWLFLTGGVFVAVVFATRRFGAAWVPFFATDRGGAVLVLACGLLQAAASVIFSGFSWQALLDGLFSAFLAAGGFGIVKKVLAPSDGGVPKVAAP